MSAQPWQQSQGRAVLELLLRHADERGVCPRSVLRQAWQERALARSGGELRPKSRRQTRGALGQVVGRQQNYRQALRALDRGRGGGKRSGAGLTSSDRLAQYLVRLERAGVVRRQGDDVIVLDWELVRDMLREEEP